MSTPKFISKYMKLAKLLGEDQNPCYSRKIGVIIVDPKINKIVGTGYNGPPRGTPHCDSAIHLQNVVWPQLSESERNLLTFKPITVEEFVDKYENCKTCPRKLIGAASGKRLELCSCAHAEANAIINASQNLYGCEMYAWCLLPCIECTKLIINAGIKKVFCLQEPVDYSVGSRYLFKQANVQIEELDKSEFE
jgi:dCMP deaminase